MHGNSFIHSIQLGINQLPKRNKLPMEAALERESAEVAVIMLRLFSHSPKMSTYSWSSHPRHDFIARLITNTCISQGWQVSWVPRLHTSCGLKKPDLIITNQDKIALVDVTVVWDSPKPLSTAYQDKLDLYNQPPICAYIAKAFGKDKEIHFGAIVISLRGAWCHCNEAMLACSPQDKHPFFSVNIYTT